MKKDKISVHGPNILIHSKSLPKEKIWTVQVYMCVTFRKHFYR